MTINNDLYLNLLLTLTKNKLLEQKYEITPLLQNQELRKTQIKKLLTKKPIAIVEFQLENKTILLIENTPRNFLSAYTILIGENTPLYKFKLKNQKETYISTPQTIENIKQFSNLQIDDEPPEKISPKTLQNLKYKHTYRPLQILEILFEYCLTINLDLNKLHIIPGDTIELFLPNQKHKHFHLAEKLSFPLTPITENNYFNQTNINIFDTSLQLQILSPKITYEIPQEIEIDKLSGKEIHYDLIKNYFLKINKQDLIEKLNKIEKTNTKLNKIKSQILDKNELKLSAPNGKIPIPLWKDTQSRYLEIQNTTDFKNYTGIPFKLENETLKNLYLQKTNAKKIEYLERYLLPNFETAIENLQKTQTLYYETIEEIILNLYYNNIKELYKKENLTQNQITETHKITKKLLKKTIKLNLSLQTQTTNNPTPQTLLEEYLESTIKTLQTLIEEYKQTKQKIKLLNKTKQKIALLQKTLNTFQLTTHSEMNALININYSINHILENLEHPDQKEHLNELNEYYKNKTKIKHPKHATPLEKAIENAIKYSNSKEHTFIINENFNQILPIIKYKTQIRTDLQPKTILKPKINYLKKIFGKSYEKIATQITQNKLNKEIKKQYYTELKIYPKYNLIFENQYLTILRKEQ